MVARVGLALVRKIQSGDSPRQSEVGGKIGYTEWMIVQPRICKFIRPRNYLVLHLRTSLRYRQGGATIAGWIMVVRLWVFTQH